MQRELHIQPLSRSRASSLSAFRALLRLLPAQENLTQEEREERRRAAEMETAVRLQREREEAEAARAEQLRKEVRAFGSFLSGPSLPGWNAARMQPRGVMLLQLSSIKLRTSC